MNELLKRAEPYAWGTPGGDVSRSRLWCEQRCLTGSQPFPLYTHPPVVVAVERGEPVEQLREVYEAARSFLRYCGVDPVRVGHARMEMENAIEKVKIIDGGGDLQDTVFASPPVVVPPATEWHYVVPLEATPAMLDALDHAMPGQYKIGRTEAKKIWKAVVAAAPFHYIDASPPAAAQAGSEDYQGLVASLRMETAIQYARPGHGQLPDLLREAADAIDALSSPAAPATGEPK